jgi:4-amino-4-deoxy-L-arabinose transferase-like glycosyltransferase
LGIESFLALQWGRYKVPAFVFLSALAVRWAFIVWRGPVVAPDSTEYLALARNLVAHGTLSLDTAAPFAASIRRVPLYPCFLGLFDWFGLGLTTVAVVQAMIDAGVAVVVLALARETAGRKWAGIAGVVYALHPGAILASATLLSETVATAFLAGSAWALAMGLRRNRLGLVAISAVGLGLATLSRPITLLLPAAIVVLLLLVTDIRRRNVVVVAFVVASVSILCPWVVRSSILAQRFVPLQTFGAVNLYVATRMDWDQKNETLLWPRVYAEMGEGATGTPEEMADLDKRLLRQAISNILAAPNRFLISRARELPFLFLTSFDKFTGLNEGFSTVVMRREFGNLLMKVSLLVVFSLIPILLAFGGLAGAFERPAAWISGTVWMYMIVMHAPVWFENRFWWPAVPFVCVSASVGATRLEEVCRRS